MSGVTLLVIAYVSLLVFAAALVYRTVKMARQPIHLRWELAPIPHEKGKSRYGGSYFEEFEWWTQPRERSLVSEAIYMFQEIVFLRAVWEHHRRLWWFSFPFHFGMYLLIVAALFLLLGAALELAGVPGSNLAALDSVVLVLAGAGYALGTLGAVGLTIGRIVDPRVRAFRTAAPLFNLGFLLLVFLSGGIALAAFGDFPARLMNFARAMISADVSIEVPGGLAVHLVLVFLFLAYLPFTQMLHFVAKYFTYHRVRWDDEAMARGSRMEAEVSELLKQPVTWSAAHLKADGKKNWVDIATETKEDAE